METPVCHLEVSVKNLARAKKFYSSLMGWKFSAMMPGYEMAGISKKSAVALCKGKTGSQGMLPYFEVKSIDQILKKAAAIRARIAMKKTEIGGDHGFMAHIKDSEGNTFGIWSMK